MKHTDEKATATLNPIEAELQATSDQPMERNDLSHVDAGMELTTSPYASTSSGVQPNGLNASVQKHIGNLLKASFQDLLTDPVPDRFSDLLNQLELAEAKKGK